MTSIINKKDNKDNKSIKVKVFYTLRGSKSTRLTTFSISQDNNIHDLSLIPIPLKTCLWSICTSSPDMICRDHDLSIYTANFHESGHLSTEKRDSLIWEGHGLMTWIMDQSVREEVLIYGKTNDNTSSSIDIYIELQPTLKWSKDEYFAALRNQSFEQFRTSTQSPLHPICNCYHVEEVQTTTTTTRQYNDNKNETEFDRYLRHRVQSNTNESSSSSHNSPPLPSRLPITNNSNHTPPVFRPEPIFPTSSSSPSTASNSNNNANPSSIHTTNSEYSNSNNKRTRLNSPPYYKEHSRDDSYNSYHHHHRSLPTQSQHSNSNSNNDLTLPMPMAYKKDINNSSGSSSRRSAFTIASISDNNNNKDHRYLPPSTSNSSTSSSASPPPSSSTKDDNIPVIYTPSNKKRKKNPMLMPTSDTSQQQPTNTRHHSSNALYQNKPSNNNMQQQQQQVNTVVRTYYEVDRDNQGAYILPVEIDSWTVVDLGTVIYERPAYHNQRYIYPANYTVRKWYRSMVDPKSDTQYTCRILENGREPKFEVTADDCPMTYSGPTPTTVWTIIVRRAFAIRNQEYGHNPVGPDFFGLRKNTIAKMIQDLPNASKCSQYIWQTFEPARFNKPGRNRRRADSTLPGSLLGGVNYGLTSSRLVHNTNLTPTQHSYRASHSSSPVQQQQQSFNNQPSSPSQQQEDDNNNSRHTSPRIDSNNHSAMVESTT